MKSSAILCYGEAWNDFVGEIWHVQRGLHRTVGYPSPGLEQLAIERNFGLGTNRCALQIAFTLSKTIFPSSIICTKAKTSQACITMKASIPAEAPSSTTITMVIMTIHRRNDRISAKNLKFSSTLSSCRARKRANCCSIRSNWIV